MSEPSNIDDVYEIRPYRSGDEIRINQQFNKIFGLDRGIEEWNWKFQLPHPSRILIACDHSHNVITHYAVLIDKFHYKGIVVNAGHSVDTYSVRQEGAVQMRIFEKVVGQFFKRYGHPEHVSLMYGFPGVRILKLGMMKLDYGVPLPVRYWERITNGELPRVQLRENYTLSLNKIDHLWKRSKLRYPISVIRDGHWVFKRYLSRPHHSYKFLRTKSWGRYSCLAVYTVEEDSIALVDLIWDGKNLGDLKLIQNLLILVAQTKGFSKIYMWLSGDEKAEVEFRKLGWLCKPEPNNLHLVVRSFDDRIDRETLLNGFYLTKGCTDII